LNFLNTNLSNLKNENNDEKIAVTLSMIGQRITFLENKLNEAGSQSLKTSNDSLSSSSSKRLVKVRIEIY
jgi:hypothetical protein